MDTILEPSAEPNIKVGISKLALSNSRLFSVIGLTDNKIFVYDIEMGDIVSLFNEHQSLPKHIFIFDDNRRILSSDGFNLCKIWVAHSGQLLESITVACNLFALSPDFKHAVSGSGENVYERKFSFSIIIAIRFRYFFFFFCY
jgi:WD40 repeat protein